MPVSPADLMREALKVAAEGMEKGELPIGVEQGLLKQESLDLFKVYVAQHPSSSGPLWDYAKALIASGEQK